MKMTTGKNKPKTYLGNKINRFGVADWTIGR